MGENICCPKKACNIEDISQMIMRPLSVLSSLFLKVIRECKRRILFFPSCGYESQPDSLSEAVDEDILTLFFV